MPEEPEIQAGTTQAEAQLPPELRERWEQNDAMDQLLRRCHELSRENAALEAENKANQAQLELHKLASGGKFCRRCAELEQRIDVLGTEHEKLKEEHEAETARLKQTIENQIPALRTTVDRLTEAWKKSQLSLDYTEEQLRQSHDRERDFDREHARIAAEADSKLQRAKDIETSAKQERVLQESEIWRRVAEKLGLQLRTGYVICEDEIIAAFELERERASQVRAKFEELVRRYELVKRQAAALQLGAPKPVSPPLIDTGTGSISSADIPLENATVWASLEKQEVPSG